MFFWVKKIYKYFEEMLVKNNIGRRGWHKTRTPLTPNLPI